MTSRKEARWLERCLAREVRTALAARTGEYPEYRVETRVWEVGLLPSSLPPAINAVTIPGESYVAGVRIKDDPLDLAKYVVFASLPRKRLRKAVRGAADLIAREFMRKQKELMRSNAPKEENK